MSHDVDGETIGQLFEARARATPSAPAYRSKRRGRWETTRWGDVHTRARAIGAGLVALGVAPGDRVAIVSATREEWALADLGLTLAAAVVVPVYPTALPAQVAYVLGHSDAVVAIVEDLGQLERLAAARATLTSLRAVVVIDAAGIEESADTWSLATLERRGRALLAERPDLLEVARRDQNGRSLAAILYTSGTTGDPKGVMVSHEAYTVGTLRGVEALPLKPTDVQLLVMPMAHSVGRMFSIVAVRVGFETAFAEGMDRVLENLVEVRPDWMAAVPRVFEKAHRAFVAKSRTGSRAMRTLLRWALRVGAEMSRELQAGRAPSRRLAIEHRIADRLVFKRFRAAFGGRVRWFLCGSSPLSPNVAEFFHGAGMLILEAYGLTETNSLTTVNREDAWRFGTVGKALHPSLELSIAPDGEILTRGVTNLLGYYKMADETRAAIDADGWFRTGDIGDVDADGYLRITDRKKDLLKTSGGKYVAPQPIEAMLRADPLIDQALVVGDGRQYVTVLVSIAPDVARALFADGEDRSIEQLSREATVRARIEAHIAHVNRALPRWEQLKAFRIMPAALTEADGALTHTLKVRRRAVTERHRTLIDAMYEPNEVRA